MGASCVGTNAGNNEKGRVAPNFSWAKLFCSMMKRPNHADYRRKRIGWGLIYRHIMMLRQLFRPTKVGRYALLFVVLALLIINNSSKAQDSTRLERYGYVVGSCLAFSLLDYIGYNTLVTPNHGIASSILSLHIFDAAFGSAINYFLYKTCGLPSAISFDLIWWMWGLDLGFSGWGDAIDPASPWVNRTNSSLNTNAITWAGWTPIGLLRKQGTVIDKYALYAQAIVGFSIAMPILW